MTAVRFHFIPSANTGLTGSGLGQEPGSRPALLTALSREEALGERNIAALSSHSAWENRLNSPLSGDDRHQSARHDARLQLEMPCLRGSGEGEESPCILHRESHNTFCFPGFSKDPRFL